MSQFQHLPLFFCTWPHPLFFAFDVVSLDGEAFLLMGDEMMSRRCQVMARTRHSRFHATFDTSPNVCAILWSMIDLAMMPKGAKAFHMMWALMLLKLHCAESVLSSLAGGVHEETFRKWSWCFVEAISHLQCKVIVWNNHFKNDIGNICLVSVDGTDFQIYLWGEFLTGWFSHKFKGPGLRYEVALCIRTGHIVWINGPFPCGQWPDLKTFRSNLMKRLGKNEKVIADDGHRGELNHIQTPSEENDILQTTRSRHETVNKRFKQWSILHRVFRHELGKHQSAFGAVAVITQLALENEEPLFPVDYVEEE